MNQKIADNITQLADMVIKQSLEAAYQRFDEFKTRVESEMNKVLTSRPVLDVQINEGKVISLSQKASPFLPRLVANARLGLYTLLVGPAGCGKTTAAHQLAQALELPFGSICLTAGASETWLFGRQTPTGFVEGSFSKIYRDGGVYLADEMDAADANLLLSINTALSHNEMLNPMNGETIKKHKDFIFTGAANTNGKGSTHLYTGRSRLDAATLDRMVMINVTYDEKLESELCPDQDLYAFLLETRRSLIREGYDEFISTRAFLFSSKQYYAGIPVNDIKNSLLSNWGDAAKSLAEKEFNKIYSKEKKQQSGTKKISTHKFIDVLLEKEGLLKWNI